MNMFIWVLQVLLALHTLVGAIWKFSNTAVQSEPSLAALSSVWLVLAVIEIVLALCLTIPVFNRSRGKLAPIAAMCIVAEMLIFCGVHFASGASNAGPVIYWLIVAAIASTIAYYRTALTPIAMDN